MANAVWGTEDTVREYGTRSSVAMLSTGGYVVTWRDNQGETASGRAAYQIYDALGAKVGDVQFVDASATTNQQYSQAQAFGSDGKFVITWFEQTTAAVSTIFTQVYDSNGPLGREEHLHLRRYCAAMALRHDRQRKRLGPRLRAEYRIEDCSI